MLPINVKLYIPRVTIDDDELVRLKSDLVSSDISSEVLGPDDI